MLARKKETTAETAQNNARTARQNAASLATAPPEVGRRWGSRFGEREKLGEGKRLLQAPARLRYGYETKSKQAKKRKRKEGFAFSFSVAGPHQEPRHFPQGPGIPLFRVVGGTGDDVHCVIFYLFFYPSRIIKSVSAPPPLPPLLPPRPRCREGESSDAPAEAAAGERARRRSGRWRKAERKYGRKKNSWTDTAREKGVRAATRRKKRRKKKENKKRKNKTITSPKRRRRR